MGLTPDLLGNRIRCTYWIEGWWEMGGGRGTIWKVKAIVQERDNEGLTMGSGGGESRMDMRCMLEFTRQDLLSD